MRLLTRLGCIPAWHILRLCDVAIGSGEAEFGKFGNLLGAVASELIAGECVTLSKVRHGSPERVPGKAGAGGTSSNPSSQVWMWPERDGIGLI